MRKVDIPVYINKPALNASIVSHTAIIHPHTMKKHKLSERDIILVKHNNNCEFICKLEVKSWAGENKLGLPPKYYQERASIFIFDMSLLVDIDTVTILEPIDPLLQNYILSQNKNRIISLNQDLDYHLLHWKLLPIKKIEKYCRITSETKLVVENKGSFPDPIGLENEKQKLIKILSKFSPPLTILVRGTSGVGKTMLVNFVLNQLNMKATVVEENQDPPSSSKNSVLIFMNSTNTICQFEIDIQSPNLENRVKLIQHYFPQMDNIKSIAEKTNGWVGNDFYLASLSPDPIWKAKPNQTLMDIPQVLWDEIGGNAQVKKYLIESLMRDRYIRMGISPPKGILLYGPPGCSKTLLVKALATQGGFHFMAVKGPELLNKYVGESEKGIRDLFIRARTNSPSIIFFDEIDALALERGRQDSGRVGDRVLSQLLSEMDGMDQLEGVMVIAATNRPDVLDKAFLRPGRMDRLIYVGLPDTDERRDIFRIKIKKMNHLLNDDDLMKLGKVTEGYSGAEITAICINAGYAALEEDLDCVSLSHFETSLSKMKPRITKESLEVFSKFNKL
jgi:ATP-dependent 26S proteasome regulatory subunit